MLISKFSAPVRVRVSVPGTVRCVLFFVTPFTSLSTYASLDEKLETKLNLRSLPYLGYTARGDSLYLATRAGLLLNATNTPAPIAG